MGYDARRAPRARLETAKGTNVWRRLAASSAAAIASSSCSDRAAWRRSIRATDSQLGRDVAVKILRPEYGRDPDFVARFRAEAQAVASLSHPNIVQVYDFGMDPVGPYIVMELRRRRGSRDADPRAPARSSPRQAARIAAEIGDAPWPRPMPAGSSTAT